MLTPETVAAMAITALVLSTLYCTYLQKQITAQHVIIKLVLEGMKAQSRINDNLLAGITELRQNTHSLSHTEPQE